jgi:hypothetical protein
MKNENPTKGNAGFIYAVAAIFRGKWNKIRCLAGKMRFCDLFCRVFLCFGFSDEVLP